MTQQYQTDINVHKHEQENSKSSSHQIKLDMNSFKYQK